MRRRRFESQRNDRQCPRAGLDHRQDAAAARAPVQPPAIWSVRRGAHRLRHEEKRSLSFGRLERALSLSLCSRRGLNVASLRLSGCSTERGLTPGPAGTAGHAATHHYPCPPMRDNSARVHRHRDCGRRRGSSRSGVGKPVGRPALPCAGSSHPGIDSADRWHRPRLCVERARCRRTVVRTLSRPSR
jgi:hypothetical protein